MDFAADFPFALFGRGRKTGDPHFCGRLHHRRVGPAAGRGFSFDAYLEKYGYDYFFREVQSVIGHDDVTVADLESVLINYSSGRVEKTNNFRGPKHYVNVLTSSSAEAVNISNNHTHDFGADGVLHTTKALNEAVQGWFGTNDTVKQAWVYEKDGV